MKSNKKKEQIIPVSVSNVVPVYHWRNRGRIIAYNVHVFFDGDLSTNTEQREEFKRLYEQHPGHKADDFFYESLRSILKPNISIPKESHLTGLFRYDREKNVSELEYSWRNGLFGCGAERAWKFRIRMLAQINKQKVK